MKAWKAPPQGIRGPCLLSRVQCYGRSGRLPLYCSSSGPGIHFSPTMTTQLFRGAPPSSPLGRPRRGLGGSSSHPCCLLCALQLGQVLGPPPSILSVREVGMFLRDLREGSSVLAWGFCDKGHKLRVLKGTHIHCCTAGRP